MGVYSTANVKTDANYIVVIDEKDRVNSVRIEGPGAFNKRVYKREPKPFETLLTPATFREAATWICKLDPKKAVRMKKEMHGDAEYLSILNDVIMELYNDYKELIEM